MEQDRRGRESLIPAGDLIEHRLREHRRQLSRLMRSPALTNGDIATALSELTELAAELLSVARASVWQLSFDGGVLECVDLFTAVRGEHERGQRIHAASVPKYFEALTEDRALAVEHATIDPRTSELSEGYLAPLGIASMLDAPVFLRGRMVGVVCHEHVGRPRKWVFWEELVAATLADFVALVLQAREQLRVEGQVRDMRARVDDILEQRTQEVVRENADLQREVDALQLAAETIRKSEDDLRRLFAASPVPLLLLRRADNRVLMANENSASVLRSQLGELYGRPLSELFVHEDQLVSLFSTLDATGQIDAQEVELKSFDGGTFWALLSGRLIAYGGEPAYMVGFHDLTAQKAVEHQLRFLAQRDAMTQAYNRHHFWQLALAEVSRVQRYDRPLAIAMLDADHFKRVNDRYGHDVGDMVLRLIVDTAQASLRSVDVLARYGGEEFIVLLPETSPDNARIVMERVRERIASEPLTLDDGRKVATTVSIGIAGLLEPSEGLESLLKRADEALYKAKRNGRNRIEMG